MGMEAIYWQGVTSLRISPLRIQVPPSLVILDMASIYRKSRNVHKLQFLITFTLGPSFRPPSGHLLWELISGKSALLVPLVPLYSGTNLYHDLVPLYNGTDVYQGLVPLYSGAPKTRASHTHAMKGGGASDRLLV